MPEHDETPDERGTRPGPAAPCAAEADTEARSSWRCCLPELGFAAVTQVRANEVDNNYASYREQDLIDVLSTMTDASRRAQSELARLERTRQDLRSETGRGPRRWPRPSRPWTPSTSWPATSP